MIKQQTPISLWTDFCNIFSFFQIQNVIFFSLETINLKQFTAAAGRTIAAAEFGHFVFVKRFSVVIGKIGLKTEKFWAKKVMIESLKVKTKFRWKKMDWKVMYSDSVWFFPNWFFLFLSFIELSLLFLITFFSECFFRMLLERFLFPKIQYFSLAPNDDELPSSI